jgi:hypothetical protein
MEFLRFSFVLQNKTFFAMKIYLLIIFSFLLSVTEAQVEDHFDDGDFSSSPQWLGNSSDFNVNAGLQLQLNATSAGNSYLSVPANLSSLDSVEWHFFIRLAFSPSSSNHARVYLSSDQADLTLPLNGYFLQFGEALSNDAIELFRQDGNNVNSICRATDGMIATSFSAGVKVTRSNVGTWTLSVDYNGDDNYITETSGNDLVYNSAAFIGVNCLYTSGNIDKFYFDDFYAGTEIGDTILPFVVSVSAESENILEVTFSEKTDSNTTFNINNYTVNNGIGNPNLVSADTINPLKFYLVFSNTFLPGVENEIFISGLKDVNQNQMTDANKKFTYTPLLTPQLNDVVFSEIYFENSSLCPLPNAEYVEIYNRRDSAISLDGWRISDGNTEGTLQNFRLGPRSYAILFSENDSSEFESVPNSVLVHSFPSLNNDVGDHLFLTNENGDIINEQQFNDSYYHDNQKNDGGWSLERIDPDYTCMNEGNWMASASNEHGTPGLVNSVSGSFSDEMPPMVTNVYLKDSNHVVVLFNENISEGLDDINNYRVTDEDGNLLTVLSVNKKSETEAELNFSSSFSGRIYFLDLSPAIRDCPGNSIQTDNHSSFGYPEEANQNDILINELLFYPFDGSIDFVEIYNNSEKIIDLKDWIIAEIDYDDSTDIKDQALITGEHRLIFPGEFLVLTEDDRKVKSFYRCIVPQAFLNVNDMPDFNSDKGRSDIFNPHGEIIDAFRYSEDLHFPLLSEVKGISLERLSYFQKSDDINNWHSAAATAGFATPGYGNSQRLDSVEFGGEVSIGTDIFSPDNDGYNDVLSIHYKFPQPGTVLSLNVFDSNGQPIRTILNGETVSNEGMISWDGLKDNRVIAPSGVYILLAKSFDLDGNTSAIKKVCFLTRRF